MIEIHALSGAYAVDALDGDERALFEQHLAECAACRDEVAELQETVAMVAETVAVEPPARLRADVLRAISQVRPLPPLTSQPNRSDGAELSSCLAATGTEAPATEPSEAATRDTIEGPDLAGPDIRSADLEEVSGKPVRPDGDESRRDELGHRRAQKVSLTRSAPFWLGAAAAAALAVGLGVTQPWAEQPRVEMSLVEQVLTADDARSVSVELADGASARVVQSAEVGRAVIETHEMPSAPEGHGYQLWLQVGEEMVPAGVMPDAADQTYLLEADAGQATAAAISIEPAGGSLQPTTDPIAFFDLQDG